MVLKMIVYTSGPKINGESCKPNIMGLLYKK